MIIHEAHVGGTTMSKNLRCPNPGCRSAKMRVDVTAVGQIAMDFAQPESDRITGTQLSYSWTPESACRCLVCGWEGNALAAGQNSAMLVMKRVLAALKKMPSGDEDRQAMRAATIAEAEAFMKKHAAELEAIVDQG